MTILPTNDDVVETYASAQPIPAPVMVQVTAPSNLEEGYTFDAVYNGEVFQVTIPPGGVKAGQTFSVPFVPAIEAVAVEVVETAPSDVESFPSTESTPMLSSSPTAPPQSRDYDRRYVPLGTWKTSLCDCLSEGLCHPSLCNAICFPQILMGQVLTRMKLNWCGFSGYYLNTTCIWMFITVVMCFVHGNMSDCAIVDPTEAFHPVESFLQLLDDDDVDVQHLRADFKNVRQHLKDAQKHWDAEQEQNNEPTSPPNCNDDSASFLQAIQFVWFWTTVCVLARLRRRVRHSYGIRTKICCEDLACALWCSCCTVSQLARQTADYTLHRAYWCTPNGLAELEDQRQEELERRHEQGHHLVHAHQVDV